MPGIDNSDAATGREHAEREQLRGLVAARLRRFVSQVILGLLWMSVSAASDLLQIDGMIVSRSGDHGVPLIFIPGLASGGWAWQPVADHFARDHVVYTVTLPGFAGNRRAGGKPLQTAEACLTALIRRERLDHPVLIGHSLGGTLALSLAARHSALIGGVVSLDGLPVFPGTEQVATDQRAEMARRFRASIPTDGAVFAQSQITYMASSNGVTDPTLAARLGKLAGTSDPVSVADYAVEALTLDLRPELKAIKVPVLLIVPYNEADNKASAFAFTEQQKLSYYRSLMQGVSNASAVPVSPSRHFAMFDQPAQVERAIAAFLATLRRP